MSPKLQSFIQFIWKKRTLHVLLGMAIAFALILLILATPLCVYLPGYLDVHKRALVMESAMRIDSLEQENDLRLAYLENMMIILNDRVKTDSLQTFDSAVTRIKDTLLTASEREELFVQNYEQKERFGLNALEEQKSGPKPVVFLAPVKGKIAVPERAEKPSDVTRVELSGNTPVMVPHEGTVIAVTYVMGEGYIVTMQHESDYITLFSHLTSVLVEVGQSLKPGRVLGYAGNVKDPRNSWIGLQLWHKGNKLDPNSIMPIE